MFGLTSLGVFHTAISLAAVIAGLVLFVRDGRISPRTRLGSAYIVLTIVVCLTGFGIFQHGGFGKPHVLGIVTLLTLAAAWLAGSGLLFRSASPYVETVAYSATFLFHMIPALAETATRLPLGAPLLQSPDDLPLQIANAVCLLVFLAGATLQVRSMRRSRHPLPGIRAMGAVR